MKSLRLAALAAALVLGACSAPTPTAPAQLDAGASFDGGNMIGSGNFTSETQDGGSSLGSGNRTESSDSTGRGGSSLGSGN